MTEKKLVRSWYDSTCKSTTTQMSCDDKATALNGFFAAQRCESEKSEISPSVKRWEVSGLSAGLDVSLWTCGYGLNLRNLANLRLGLMKHGVYLAKFKCCLNSNSNV